MVAFLLHFLNFALHPQHAVQLVGYGEENVDGTFSKDSVLHMSRSWIECFGDLVVIDYRLQRAILDRAKFMGYQFWRKRIHPPVPWR